jgi:type IV secretion system protein VirB10
LSASEPADDAVHGERGRALVNAARSVQARLSSALAAGLMITLGVAALTWYYAHAVSRHREARAAAQSKASARAQSEMPLPALGPIVAPVAASAPTAPPPAAAEAVQPLEETPAALPPAPGLAAGSAVAEKSPVELAHERRLSGAVFVRDQQAPHEAAAPEDMRSPMNAAGGGAMTDAHAETSGATGLSSWLRPTASPAVQAQLLPGRRLLLPKGAFIDCTLETAIDSTLPGMTTCVTAADTFSADGKVVLLERGTKLVGETRGQVQQGQARLFVLWSEARTPQGVVVPLDSPGTDELGRAGLPGEVERHFWQRFGAAMLVSVVDGAVQAGVQATNRSGGSVIYAPSASADVATEALKGTLNISPTVVKRNGDRIQILVARDLDFRAVYELHLGAGR